MWITTDQAIEMYARFCRARYGADAMRLADARAAELGEAGDDEGERIWRAVKARIETQNPN
jgi:hypothetical protein